ncbi:hypothetical protein Fcan01_03679 [Folsomia candida]|uniref:MARVEL domain-containing protein n=1 Tax=Folsomia candida TaxID=158441 RepID=A0A226F461_FOLCA|nr:hypothetical protein Fcan01_03679 [Folsomia candida]
MPSKCQIPRDWSKSEQLSVSEKISLRSGTNSASARYVNSVSDVIRDLEPVHTDDDQFEIDGSIRLPFDMTCDDSRTSIRSWDSHTFYHNNTMEDPATRQGGPISMYCDTNHFKTPIGILRIVLLVASAVSLGCLVYSGTAKYGLFMLPYVARIRFMLFIILFNALVTLLLLFLDVSLLHHAFPIHYHKWVIAVYVMLCSGFCGASALIVSLVHIYVEHFPWVAKVTRDQLIACSVFGFLAGFAALLMAVFATYELCRLHLPIGREDTDQLTLTERASREMQRMQDSTSSTNKKSQMLHSPPSAMEPPVTATIWPIDDVQPCSSKHITCPPPNCNNTGSHIHGHSQNVGSSLR